MKKLLLTLVTGILLSGCVITTGPNRSYYYERSYGYNYNWYPNRFRPDVYRPYRMYPPYRGKRHYHYYRY